VFGHRPVPVGDGTIAHLPLLPGLVGDYRALWGF
jgi:hypothetical protein